MLLKETEQSEDLVMGERVRGELTKGEVKLVRLDVTAIAFFASCLVLVQLGVAAFSFLVGVSLKFACLSIWVFLEFFYSTCCLGFCLFVAGLHVM